MNKFIIIAIILIAFLTGFIVKCSFTKAPVTRIDTIQINHSKDSTAYYKVISDLNVKLKQYQSLSDFKDIQILALKRSYSQKIKEVKSLPVPQRVDCFMKETGGGIPKMSGDTCAMIPISNIDSANMIILTGNECYQEKLLLSGKIGSKDSIISILGSINQKSMSYINQVEKSYLASRSEVSGMEKQLKKEIRKRHWTVIGMSAIIAGTITLYFVK